MVDSGSRKVTLVFDSQDSVAKVQSPLSVVNRVQRLTFHCILQNIASHNRHKTRADNQKSDHLFSLDIFIRLLLLVFMVFAINEEKIG